MCLLRFLFFLWKNELVTASSPCVRGEGGWGVLRAVWRSVGLWTRVTGMEVQSWAHEHPGSGFVSFQWLHCLLFTHSVMSSSLQSHGLQHARLPYPSLTPKVCSYSCPLSWWCHPTITSAVAPTPPALNLSQHQGHFQWVASSYQVAKYCSFSYSISPSNEY